MKVLNSHIHMLCSFTICILLLFFNKGIFAQSKADQKQVLFEGIDLFKQYQDNVELRRIGGQKVDTSKIRIFLSLFAPSAIIFDDINPEDFEAEEFTLRSKAVKEYLKDIETNYPGGLSVSISKATFQVVSPEEVNFYFHKLTEANTVYKGKNITMLSQDTLKMKMTKTTGNLKIISVERIGSSITCNPCYKEEQNKSRLPKQKPTKDIPVSDVSEKIKVEKEPKEPKTPKETVESNLKGFGISLVPAVGFGVSKETFSDLNFDRSSSVPLLTHQHISGHELTSSKGFISFSLDIAAIQTYGSFQIGGITGIHYFSTGASIRYDSLSIGYYEDLNNPVQYITSQTKVEDKVRVSTVSIPLHLYVGYKVSKRKDVFLFLEAGPDLHVGGKMKSEYTSEACGTDMIVHFDEYGNQQADLSGNIDAYDWVVNENTVGANPADYFSALQSEGYSVKIRQQQGGETSSVGISSAIGFSAKLGIRYYFGDRIFLQPAFRLGVVSLKQKTDGWQSTDDGFISGLEASPSVDMTKFGLDLGFGFTF